jgi:hypothetical protein
VAAHLPRVLGVFLLLDVPPGLLLAHPARHDWGWLVLDLLALWLLSVLVLVLILLDCWSLSKPMDYLLRSRAVG